MGRSIDDLRSIIPILATATDGIVLTDTDCHVVYVNQAFTELTGYTLDDLIGRTCSMLQGADTDTMDVERLRVAIRSATPYSGELLNYSRAGVPFWNDLTVTPIVRHGTLTGYLGITRDSTARKQAIEAHASRERLYRFLFEHVQAGIVLHRADTEVVYANRAALDILGMRYDELLGAYLSNEHFKFVREDGTALPQEEFPVARVLATRLPVSQYVMGLHRPSDGSLAWVLCNGVANLDDDGLPTEVVVSFTDVTRLKSAEHALKQSEIRLRLILRGTNDAAWDYDLQTGDVYYSLRWWDMLGMEPETLPLRAQLWKERMHPDDIAPAFASLDAFLSGTTESYELEFRLRHHQGHYVPVLSRGFILRDEEGRPIRVSGANTDLSERKHAEQQIYQLAFYDMLTGLPNRRKLMERLGELLALPADEHGFGVMLFIDVDNFKLLNDTVGHEFGDLLLQQITQRLQARLPGQDVLGRFGGDEFIALLAGLGNDQPLALQKAEVVASAIRDVLAQPYTLGNLHHVCTVSIGLALFDYGDRGAEMTLKHADLAMYHAKSAGKNQVCVYDRTMESSMQDRLLLEQELRAAFQARQLRLYLQPQVDKDGRIVSAEMLLRWKHHIRGEIPPAQFIPLAETTGLIVPMGEWIIETACQQLASWARYSRTAGLSLSVNVSVRQFNDHDFVQSVLDILKRTGADPSRLVLEVTESLFAQNMEQIIERMMHLRERGVRFALDDFGTGYSSLSYLQRMPLDELKIDRSFVQSFHHGEHGATITRMIISLADSLGIKTVAEGVETPEQRDFLYHHGCCHYQGYLFSEAVTVEAFDACLR